MYNKSESDKKLLNNVKKSRGDKMLINFKIKNFLSYKELTEFSMIAGNTKRMSERLEKKKDFSILKFSAIYGANASGKTNLVKAMAVMQHIVTKGFYKYTQDYYFKFDENNKFLPTYFEVELAIENKNYAYGFEYIMSKNEITSEWLIELGEKENIIFERNLIEGTFKFNLNLTEDLGLKFDVYKDDLKNDSKSLFASFIYNKKNLLNECTLDPIINIVRWFWEYLRVTEPSDIITSTEYYLDDDSINEMSRLLKMFDTGIDKMGKENVSSSEVTKHISSRLLEHIRKELIENEEGPTSIMLRTDNDIWMFEFKNEEICHSRVYFYHNGIPLISKEESAGTMRLLDIAGILLTNSKNSVFIIDEIDRCLHPQVTCQFIKMFLEKAKETNNQLIVTTHESRLLDFDVLRRDEIWFANKNQGITELYSLEEFNERFDKKIDKAYLEGRYGGVPIFDTVFPNILK